jgi:CubicO group peptidase (beta-lactamase class C family)
VEGEWETVEPTDVGWDAAKLDAALDLAGERNSSGVVILHSGRLMTERYWALDEPSQRYPLMFHGTDGAGRAIEDVASVTKSLISVLSSMAQERGFLTIDDSVTAHLGEGWTLATPEQEAAITIRHLLSMTSGLTAELQFEVEPQTKWLYNTPAYTHIMRILARAANLSRGDLTSEWLTSRIGMHDSRWEPRPLAASAFAVEAVGFATTARDLARFGLLVAAGGRWHGQVIIEDTAYLERSLRPSQNLNPSYGYLWWLNGQPFSLSTAPTPERIDESRIAAAPDDLVAALGGGDRKLYIVPSLDLVVTRLGDIGSVEGSSFDDAFWELLIQAAPNRVP